jgi:hypothetical protein
MPKTLVTLSASEIVSASLVGVMRYLAAKRAARAPAYGAERGPSVPIANDILGAWGEAAAAKCCDRYYLGTGSFRGDDVGPWQVRTTALAAGALILHPADVAGRGRVPYVGVQYLGPADGGESFAVNGWALPVEVGTPEFWCDPTGKNRPAWFVPPAVLRPIETLPGYRAADPGEDWDDPNDYAGMGWVGKDGRP